MADQTGSNGTGTQASVTANIWDARGVQHSITIGGLPAGQWVSGQYQVSRFQTAVVQLTGFTDTPQQVLRVVDLATGAWVRARTCCSRPARARCSTPGGTARAPTARR